MAPSLSRYAEFVTGESGAAVVAVVASYRPDSQLVALVRALGSLGIFVLVTDDGSPVTSDPILRECGEIAGVRVLRHIRNKGIARGLNEGLRFAQEHSASWLLTFDQDSEITPNYVDSIVGYAKSLSSFWNVSVHVGAVGAAHVQDNHGELNYPITIIETGTGSIACTEEVIQSGTLWNVEALGLVGGFDESLGLDAVDAAACLRLREKGYRVVLATEVTLIHHLGESRPVQLFGRTVLATGHSADRRATMMRNRLRLAPAEFRQSPKHAFRTLRRVGVNAYLGATSESEGWAKMKGTLRGFIPKRRH